MKAVAKNTKRLMKGAPASEAGTDQIPADAEAAVCNNEPPFDENTLERMTSWWIRLQRLTQV